MLSDYLNCVMSVHVMYDALQMVTMNLHSINEFFQTSSLARNTERDGGERRVVLRRGDFPSHMEDQCLYGPIVRVIYIIKNYKNYLYVKEKHYILISE